MKRVWVSCSKFTVRVEIDEDARIIRAAPIVHRFQGQNLRNLLEWADKFGGLLVWVEDDIN